MDDDQVSRICSPIKRLVGFADIETVGGTGAAGVGDGEAPPPLPHEAINAVEQTIRNVRIVMI